jgi:hypothetical protein
LEASYIIYFLQPHHSNFNKRLVKSPKLYFYDTGVACALLGIEKESQLSTHYLKGGLFENFIINEFIKGRVNEGRNPNAYFWLSKDQKEIDIILDQGGTLIPIEIKAGKTRNTSFFSNLQYWNKLTGDSADKNLVIYGGDENVKTSLGAFVSWKNLETIF